MKEEIPKTTPDIQHYYPAVNVWKRKFLASEIRPLDDYKLRFFHYRLAVKVPSRDVKPDDRCFTGDAENEEED